MFHLKIMLAFIATFLITWCVIGLIGYLLCDITYRECITHTGIICIMLLFGWIPAVIVCADVGKKLREY